MLDPSLRVSEQTVRKNLQQSTVGRIVVEEAKRNRLDFLDGTEATSVRQEPFAHVHLAPAIDPEIYRELARSFPTLDSFTRGRPVDGNVAARILTRRVVDDDRVTSIWREFFRYHVSEGFWRNILRVFESDIRVALPYLEERLGRAFDEVSVTMRHGGAIADANLDCRFVVSTLDSVLSSVKTPHVDLSHKIFSALL